MAGKRYVITGKPGAGKTSWVEERRQPGDLVWDFDRVAEVVSGVARHPRPAYVRDALYRMRFGLADFVRERSLPCDVYFIVAKDEIAEAMAQLIAAELVRL